MTHAVPKLTCSRKLYQDTLRHWCEVNSRGVTNVLNLKKDFKLTHLDTLLVALNLGLDLPIVLASLLGNHPPGVWV